MREFATDELMIPQSDLAKEQLRHRFPRWHSHIGAIHTSEVMQDWLSNRDSLTARLVARSSRFRVQRLRQGRAMCLRDEFHALGLPRVTQVTEREVLLRCDERAVVYAHTVLSLDANASHWPLFASLGNRSLGSTLFSDPQVERGQLYFARLGRRHPLMQRIVRVHALADDVAYLWARRSVFRRKGSPLLVTEVFLPEILDLPRISGQ
ncbi:chorismate lyase [Undibacterium cyanobacteriorum]|uniref:Probable chorismate pyruvate-lyase n=1 Tax=Undibacterium cyanobacteriorum TaxID=3073561 RepID=A0ABY9RFN5_9BURK|nr:chorismate lyase [Undibacterium sp. 20NA77.5]WMW79464.1 chorismate lyase [Undibacterium sp. 20NA77.5]